MAISLTSQAIRFVDDLDEMGFGADNPIDGGDCVEFIDQNQALLRKLPALAEFADEVDRFFGAKGDYSGSLIESLRAAHDKLKGA